MATQRVNYGDGIRHQQNTARHVEDALALLTTDRPDTAKLRALLEAAQAELISPGNHHREAFCPVYYNVLIPSHAGVPAQKAFDIFELLELILLNFPIADLYRVQSVNRQMRDSVDASVKLRQRMFLEPDDRTEFRPLPGLALQFPGSLSISVHHSQAQGLLPESRYELVSVDISPPYPIIGARRRRALIVQPPIHEMQIESLCCHRQPNPKVVLNGRGLTVGDLLDVVSKWANEHERCPHATVWRHDVEGKVRVQVVFKATVHLAADDPIVVQRARERAERQARFERERAYSRRMQSFVASKRAAYYSGAAIPTLTQFEAGQRADDP